MFKVSHLVSTKDYSAEKDKHKRSVELVFEHFISLIDSISSSICTLQRIKTYKLQGLTAEQIKHKESEQQKVVQLYKHNENTWRCHCTSSIDSDNKAITVHNSITIFVR